jgi:hypothetical protein
MAERMPRVKSINILPSLDLERLLSDIPESQATANYHFCNWLKLTARYLTGNHDYDFVYFAGMTGALVGCYWCYDVRWDAINMEYAYHDFRGRDFPGSRELIDSVYRSFGFECEVLSRREIRDGAGVVWRRMRGSIDDGYPILSFGLQDTVGDLIVGYGNGNSVYVCPGVGYYDSSNRDFTRVEDPLSKSVCLVLIKAKASPLSDQERAYAALRNIRTVLNIPSTDEYAFAEEAYDAWAYELANFSQEKYEGKDFGDLHASLKVTVMTGNYHIGRFLDRIMPCFGDDIRSKLLEAKECFRRQGKAFDELSKLEPGFWFDQRLLLDRSFGKQLSDRLLEARGAFAEAKAIINGIAV